MPYHVGLQTDTTARTSLSFMGMGTTLVVAVLWENRAYIAHAGDSRAYHLLTKHSNPEGEDTLLHRITNDHTMGDSLLLNGVRREQIPEKQFHTLTRSVGCGDAPQHSRTQSGRYTAALFRWADRHADG
ncbi:MAG TPA: hypothetical protein HPP76_04170 [Desulfuromonadales bacterium]|nr:hypothetical protein [Desulfuromonadales bacterium]